MSTLFNDLMEGLDSVEAYTKGERAGFQVHVPAEIDVAKIRKDLKMTQAGFCRAFGFSLDTVKHWEGGRRTPELAARVLLTVIARDPKAVIAALHPEVPAAATQRKSTPRTQAEHS
jgi:putative transcriptional regulator